MNCLISTGADLTTNQDETGSATETVTPNFQFQLSHIFYVTTLLAIAVFLAPWLLVPAVAWMLLCYYSKLPELRTERVSRLGWSVLLACCLLGPLLFPPLSTPPLHVNKSTCKNNMRQLQLAMLNYESSFNEFPEATELDTAGKPMHSWRVRILPFIEEQALYDQYDFSQPWDSPTNLNLLDKMPNVFSCPCCEESNRTFYKLVVGPGTLFDGGERTFDRIMVDGSSNTIAIVEDGQNPVEWTRPSDISIDEAIAALAPKDFRNLPHFDDSAFDTIYAPGVVALFDGGVLDCREFTGSDPELLRNMLQINDGNIVDHGEFVRWDSHVVPKSRPRMAAILFLIMMIYPLVWVLSPNRNRSIDRSA